MKIYNVLFLLILLAVTSCDPEEEIVNSPPIPAPTVPKQSSGYETKISLEEAISMDEDSAIMASKADSIPELSTAIMPLP